MAITISKAGKPEIREIAGVFRKGGEEFRKRNIDTNILSDFDWSEKRLAAQGKAGGVFVAKDSKGALAGFGMPVTYSIQIMGNEGIVEMQAAFAGNQRLHGGEKAAIASYQACYESASFVMFLPHETKDAAGIYRLLLESVVAAARAMPGIRRISGAMPEGHGKIPEGLGMHAVGNAKTVYEIAFEGKKIRRERITLYPASAGSAGSLDDIGPNEDGIGPRKKARNFC